MIVVTIDADKARTVDLRVEDLGGLEVGGHQNAVAFRPRRAAWAATELARFPVEEQPTVVEAEGFCALASATETTRSLKLRVGKQTASFLM